MKRTFAPGSLLLLGVLVAGLCAVPPRPAHAAEADLIERLDKKAMEDYDALEFESARRTLTDCVAKLRSAGLDETPLAAKTHIHLGIVYIAGFHDRGRGQQQFAAALKIDSSARLDPALATPELQEVFDAAVAAAPKGRRPSPGSGPGETGVSEPATPQPKGPAPGALQHTPVEEVAAGQKVNIYAHPTVSIASATLFYRIPGQERYAQAQMGRSRKQPGDIVGQLPAEITAGRSFQYYIEVYDAAGQVVGRQASADSPFIVSVAGGKAAPMVIDDIDHEDPLAQARREQARREAARAHRDWVYFDVALGNGFGFIAPGATTEVAWYYDRTSKLYQPSVASSGGAVWAGLPIRAEVGVYAWKGLSIGASAWVEAYLNHNADSSNTPPLCTKSDGTMSNCYATTSKGQSGFVGLAKVRYQFRRDKVFRPYAHFDIGGGIWRSALNIDGSKPMNNGAIDNASPFQPTDICSATYNGMVDPNRLPPGCSSVGHVPGYNLQNPMPTAPNLNRVCPMEGPCIDAVLMGNFAIGGGGGFYVGTPHIGFTADANLLILAGGNQFGLVIEVFMGPQFIF